MSQLATVTDRLIISMATIADKLIAFKAVIDSVPPEYRQPLIDHYVSLSDTILQHFSLIMERDKTITELLEQAKLDTQYIAFDLEATRRERDNLKKQQGD